MKKLKRIAVQLARVCAAGFALASCEVEPLAPETCPGGCDAQMIFPVEADANGYYHIDLNWDGEYLPWFYVDVEATEVDNEYKYNNNSVVEATFDSNTSWIIGSDLIIQQPIYNPFFGNYTSSWEPIPTEFVDVELPQYTGTELNIAQGTKLYFSKKNGKLKTRRVLGPFPPAMKGDTITLYMKVYWEAGPLSFTKDDFSQKFIVE
jgi:hypothetical protein